MINTGLTVYYQTFRDIHEKIWDRVDRVIIASLHFMPLQGGDVCLHLNDKSPDDSIFDEMWDTMEEFAITKPVGILIGGAGGGLSALLDDPWNSMSYSVLQALLASKPFIGTIVIDVEELVDIHKLSSFLTKIRKDYPDYGIAMTPICSAVTGTTPGMGGFRYRELVDICSVIDEFMVQIYQADDFTRSTCETIRKMYPEQMITPGFLSSEFIPKDLQARLMSEQFTNVILWELGEHGTEALVRAFSPLYRHMDWERGHSCLRIIDKFSI